MMHSYVKEGEFGLSCSGGRAALISAGYQWNLEGLSAHSGLGQADSDLKGNVWLFKNLTFTRNIYTSEKCFSLYKKYILQRIICFITTSKPWRVIITDYSINKNLQNSHSMKGDLSLVSQEKKGIYRIYLQMSKNWHYSPKQSPISYGSSCNLLFEALNFERRCMYPILAGSSVRALWETSCKKSVKIIM